MRRHFYLPGLLVAVAALAVQASPTPYTSVYAEAAAWNRTTNQWTCGTGGAVADSHCVVSNFGILNENSSKNNQWYALTNTAYAEGHAWVDDQGLHAYSQIDLTGYPIDVITPYNHYSSSFTFSGFARAAWSDTITFGASQSGDVTLQFALDGSKYTFGSANAYSVVNFSSNLGSGSWTLGQTTFSPNILPLAQTFSYTLHNVTPGQQLTYTLQLDAKTAVDGVVKNGTPQLVTDSAVANFGNTLKIFSIDLQDSNGALMNDGFTLTSTSGYNYNQFVGAASAVPEPSTLLTLAGGAIVLLVRRRKRS